MKKWNLRKKKKCGDFDSKCGHISDLQLFDGLSFLADDQAHFVGGDEDLLDGAVAVHVAVEAGTVAALLHDLVQQSLGLPVGGRRQVTFLSTELHKQVLFFYVKRD